MRDSHINNSAVASVIKRIAPASLTLTSCLFLVSCGSFDATSLAKKSVKSVANLMPSRIPIAQVREADLQKMPTGADRALAWDRHLNRKRYVFVPSNYKPPTLPDSRSLPMDGGILPPLRPQQGSTD